MVSDVRNKYRLRLSDGTQRDVYFVGDMAKFTQFIRRNAIQGKWLTGTVPKTTSVANWLPNSQLGRDVPFQASRVGAITLAESTRGMYDRRDGEFYRTIRCGRFIYKNRTHELEWMAEDLRYAGKNKRKPLGIPAPAGGGGACIRLMNLNLAKTTIRPMPIA